MPVCSYALWPGVADARASLRRRRRVVPGRKTHLRIRLGTSGREVGGGDGPDHGTSGNPRNSLESEGSRLLLRRSGVHGRNGPQWRTRPWVSRRKLSRVLDPHRHFSSNSLRKKAVVFGRRRYGEAKRGKRSGGASGHASVRGGLKARTPFLRGGTPESRSVLGTTSIPSRGRSRLSRERIPTLWV